MLAVATLVAPLAPFARTALAQPAEQTKEDEAYEHFKRGVAFYKDADFTAALVEFKRAYEIAPSYRVLYNLGQTSRELRDYATALTSFDQYLTESAADPGLDEKERGKREKAEAYVKELRPKVAIVTIEVNVAGAEVLVDDIPIGESPLKKPVFMNAGRRKVTVSKSGFNPNQRFVDVGGTDEKTVKIELLAVGGPSGPNPKGPPTKPPEPGLSPVPFVFLGLTGATGIATAILGARALSLHSDYETELGKFPGNPEAIESARSGSKDFALGADILGGVTIASAAVTVILFVALNQSSGEEEKKDEKPAEPKVGISLSPGFMGLSGSF
ncbi:MAG: PEGA domain-containing protein [Polyangiaceae bacterium]